MSVAHRGLVYPRCLMLGSVVAYMDISPSSLPVRTQHGRLDSLTVITSCWDVPLMRVHPFVQHSLITFCKVGLACPRERVDTKFTLPHHDVRQAFLFLVPGHVLTTSVNRHRQNIPAYILLSLKCARLTPTHTQTTTRSISQPTSIARKHPKKCTRTSVPAQLGHDRQHGRYST